MASDKKLRDFNAKEPIFVDANIFIFHALGTNEEAVEFLKRIETGEIRAITTSLTLDEVFFKLLMEEASTHLKKASIFNVKGLLRDKDNRDKVVLPVIAYRQYIEGLIMFGLNILSVSHRDVMDALNKTQEYGLLITDAVYLTVMENNKIRHIASDDKDFEGIKEVTVWKP